MKIGSCIFIAGTNLKAVLVTKFIDNSALEKSHLNCPPYQLKDLQMSVEYDSDGCFLFPVLILFRWGSTGNICFSAIDEKVAGKVSALTGSAIQFPS